MFSVRLAVCVGPSGKHAYAGGYSSGGAYELCQLTASETTPAPAVTAPGVRTGSAG